MKRSRHGADLVPQNLGLLDTMRGWRRRRCHPSVICGNHCPIITSLKDQAKNKKANSNCFQILNEDEQRNKHEVRERENARADENASNRLKGGARAREGQITRVGS